MIEITIREVVSGYIVSVKGAGDLSHYPDEYAAETIPHVLEIIGKLLDNKEKEF